jgi:hypothetical protein
MTEPVIGRVHFLAPGAGHIRGRLRMKWAPLGQGSYEGKNPQSLSLKYLSASPAGLFRRRFEFFDRG